MKKIVLDVSVLNDPQKTGIGVYTYNLIKSLLQVNKKDQFTLFGISTIETYHDLKNNEFAKLPNVKVKVFPLPARLFRTVFLLWQKFNWPPVELLAGKFDIFHSFNWYLPPHKKGKMVATIFDLTSISNPFWHHPKTIQLDKIRLSRIKNQADLVVTISENSKKDLLKFYPKIKAEVIYPAVEIKKTYNNVLGKYHLQSDYFLSVATLEPRKNLPTLIKAYLKSGLKNQLVLVGKSGWKNKQLIKLIDKNSDRIKSLGFIPDKDLPSLYKNALCFVYPSFYEGFGMPVLEALSYGLPTITSNSSSLPEAAGQAALYFDPKEETELVKLLKKIVGDKKLRQELARKGLRHAKNFSWIASAKKLNKLYEKLT